MNEYKKKTNNSTEAYRKTEVLTANRETILLMLYAGAIRFLKRAIEAHENKKWEERAQNLVRTQEIITELRTTLNFEVGGELAKQLDELYAYCNLRLTEGGVQNKPEYFQEVLGHLTALNTAWEDAVAALKKEKSEKTNEQAK